MEKHSQNDQTIMKTVISDDAHRQKNPFSAGRPLCSSMVCFSASKLFRIYSIALATQIRLCAPRNASLVILLKMRVSAEIIKKETILECLLFHWKFIIFGPKWNALFLLAARARRALLHGQHLMWYFERQAIYLGVTFPVFDCMVALSMRACDWKIHVIW